MQDKVLYHLGHPPKEDDVLQDLYAKLVCHLYEDRVLDAIFFTKVPESMVPLRKLYFWNNTELGMNIKRVDFPVYGLDDPVLEKKCSDLDKKVKSILQQELKKTIESKSPRRIRAQSEKSIKLKGDDFQSFSKKLSPMMLEYKQTLQKRLEHIVDHANSVARLMDYSKILVVCDMEHSSEIQELAEKYGYEYARVRLPSLEKD